VTAVAPDAIKLDDADLPPQLNLFLYRVAPNPGWRNAGLPGYDSAGTRIANPPLALDLHYLLTAYGKTDLQAEILLGYGMQLLHEHPWLDRATISRALTATPLDPAVLPEAFRDPPAAGLADQAEGLKISFESLTAEELSRLWSAIQSHYRPSAAYQVSVVLIEATHPPARSALPVLRRSIGADASLDPPVPTLAAVAPQAGQDAARPGEPVTLTGFHLAGTGVVVRFAHRLLATPHEIPLPDNADPDAVTVTLPAASPQWPAGVWSVTVALTVPGETQERETNAAALLLAPQPVLPPAAISRSGTRVTVDLAVTPTVHSGQRAELVIGTVGSTGTLPDPPGDPIRFLFRDLPPGTQPVRIRVDGVQSQLVLRPPDRPPAYDPTQRIAVP
jgi:hypothetical protein